MNTKESLVELRESLKVRKQEATRTYERCKIKLALREFSLGRISGLEEALFLVEEHIGIEDPNAG